MGTRFSRVYQNYGSQDEAFQSHVLSTSVEYNSLEQVTEALRKAGLESSNLIVGIDFTKSNNWTGKVSFGDQCLHEIGYQLNPYEQAISIIGKTLSDFDEDNLIPCFGFGDVTTHDKDVFCFYSENQSCNGFREVLSRYKELLPNIKLSGPTSFAPIIDMAINIVNNSRGQYHILLIIADGQVTGCHSSGTGQYSPQEQDTINAIIRASEYPLSIILVGVGDGPWDLMKEFDDRLPQRAFDNFQFVNFTEIMSKDIPITQKETNFAVEALQEIPYQYQATVHLHNHRRGIPVRKALPPPMIPVNLHPIYHPSAMQFLNEIFHSPANSQT